MGWWLEECGDGATILENQSHIVIMTNNGEDSQPQQKERKKKEDERKHSEIQLY